MNQTTIAVLIRETFLFAGNSVWQGAREEARRQGVNIIFIEGKFFWASSSSVVYDLISSPRISGVINWSVADPSDKMIWFKNHLGNKPLVALTVPIEGHPVVRVDPTTGFYEAVHHLVHRHGITKFAFIRGRDSNRTFKERFDAFKKALSDEGLHYDERLNIDPTQNSNPQTGVDFVRTLIQERGMKPGVDFQAVLGVSEGPMVGAFQELKRLGVKVPDEVAVIGMDSAFLSKAELPRMTSVMSPILEQANTSVKLMCQMLLGEKIPRETTIPSYLQIYESCGCISSSVKLAQSSHIFKDDRQSRQKSALTHARHANPQEVAQVVIKRLLSENPNNTETIQLLKNRLIELPLSVAADVAAQSNKTSTSTLGILVLNFVEESYDFSILYDLLTLTSAEFSAWYKTDVEQAMLRSIIGPMRIRISESVPFPDRAESMRIQDDFILLRNLVTAISSTFELAEAFKKLSAQLPNLGINHFWIVVYDQKKNYSLNDDISAQSHVVYALSNGQQVALPVGGEPFATNLILPDHLMPANGIDFFIHPLEFNSVQMGYMIAHGAPQNRLFYTTIANQLSNNLQGAKFLADQKNAEEELSRTFSRLKDKVQLVSHDSKDISDRVTGASSAMHEVAANIQSIDHLVQQISAVVTTAVGKAEAAGQKVAALTTLMEKISEATNIISDISERTSVLSINAGIQAARARENGKGFGIIAQEVRKLAEEASVSTERIHELVNNVSNSSGQVSTAIKDMTGIVGNVNELSEQIKEAISQQNVATGEISEQLNQVADGSSRISAEISELAKHS